MPTDERCTLTITRTQELDLPRQVDVIYLNRTADYQAGTQSSQRQTVNAQDYDHGEFTHRAFRSRSESGGGCVALQRMGWARACIRLHVAAEIRGCWSRPM
jgi:hypothetical protein